MTEPKTKFGKWIDNIWYHYKWEILIALFFIVVLAVVIPQAVTKTEYEVSVLFTGPEFVDANESKEIESAIRQVMKDYDGNGSRDVQLEALTAFTSEQIHYMTTKMGYSQSALAPYSESNVMENFSTQIFAGEASVCILDPYWYKVVKDEDGFVPLSEALGFTPENAYDEYSVKLKDTDFGRFFGAFKIIPDDCLLCIRRMSTAAAFLGQKKTETKYEYSKQLFRDIISFTAPEQ